MNDDTKPLVSNLETETLPIPNKEVMRRAFESKKNAREKTEGDFKRELTEKVLSRIFPRPALKTRSKSFESYYKKYLKQCNTGNPQISDQVGLRIICHFKNDLKQIKALIESNFTVTEVEYKGHSFGEVANTFPQVSRKKQFLSFKEFGYESIHLLVKIPAETVRLMGNTGCDVVEIQIRTTLQDAWAEVEHELFYKTEFSALDEPMQRKLHAVSASLSLADAIFQEIRDHQKKYNNKRVIGRANFYDVVDEVIDDFVVSSKPDAEEQQHEYDLENVDADSIDEMLLSALTFHASKRFKEAIAIYSQILEQIPTVAKPICTLIHKHRGLSYFSLSRYDDAMSDFTKAIELGEESGVCAYYRGITHFILKQYKEAIDDFTLSLELKHYHSYCLYRRGQAYYHMGDYLQALSDCESALSLEPNLEKFRKFRDIVQEKLQL